MNEEWWFQAVEGFCRQTGEQMNKQIDICECRIPFATEKNNNNNLKDSNDASK